MTTFHQRKRSVKSGLSTRFRFKQGTLVLFHGAGVQHIYFLCPNIHIVTIYCTLKTQSICLSTYWINTMKHLSFCGRKHPGDGAIVHTNEVVLLSSLFSQVLIWPHAPWKTREPSFTLYLKWWHCARDFACYVQPSDFPASSHSSSVSVSSYFYSKPAMWVPRLFWHDRSRDQRRWCWIWRWSRSTMSSTSEAAPSSVWRYSSPSTRSERPNKCHLPRKIPLHSSAADSTACLTQVIKFLKKKKKKEALRHLRLPIKTEGKTSLWSNQIPAPG